MLKIKDDVDLKELEKFGFRKSGGIYQLDLKTDWNRGKLGFIISCIYVQIENRIIRLSTHEATEITKLDIIYDLIKAGLIEESEDKRG